MTEKLYEVVQPEDTSQKRYEVVPPAKFSGFEPTTGMPLPADTQTAKEMADALGKSSISATAGGGAGLLQSAPVPIAQLLAHGASTAGIPGGETAAKYVDKFNDYLSQDRGLDYNLARGIGEYGPPLVVGGGLIKAATKGPQTISTAVRELPNVVNMKGLPVMAEEAVTKAGGIFSKLGETAGNALSSGLMSLATRPVDNAQEEGFWGPKLKQAGIESALGAVGPGADLAWNAVKSVPGMKTALGTVAGPAATIFGYNGINSLLSDPGGTVNAITNSVKNVVTDPMSGGILAALAALKGLRLPGSRAYNGPALGGAVNAYDNYNGYDFNPAGLQ